MILVASLIEDILAEAEVRTLEVGAGQFNDTSAEFVYVKLDIDISSLMLAVLVVLTSILPAYRIKQMFHNNEVENSEETEDMRIESITEAVESSNENCVANHTETVTNELNCDFYNNDDEDDEEIKRFIEGSKRDTKMTEEEMTILAIEESKREARNKASLDLQVEEQMKEVIEYSLEHSPNHILVVSETFAEPAPVQRPSYSSVVSSHLPAITASLSSNDLTGADQLLSMTEDQQLELALRQSLDPMFQVCRGESESPPPPYNSRVLQPLSVTSNTSANNQLGVRPKQTQPVVKNKDNIPQTRGSLRPIFLDAGNICYYKGKCVTFELDGLSAAIQWFTSRGHKHVLAVLPASRRIKLLKEGRHEDVETLDDLHKRGLLTFTPSRKTDERCWDSYDDRYMIEFAAEKKGIVVSNDQFQDLLSDYPIEKPPNYEMYLEQIRNRTLGFAFMFDHFKPDPSPRGKDRRYKVSLEDFLKY